MNFVEDQLAALQREGYPAATGRVVEGGTLVTIEHFPLPPGWNLPEATVWFVAPTGYPFAKPDCFWTSPGLVLAKSGRAPMNANQTAVPGLGGAVGTWFSWHMEQWQPNRDTLVSYVKRIKHRLMDLR